MAANTIRSIGIVMDGNRRWAKAHNLPALEGHRQGLQKLKELASWMQETTVKEVILYAFSTENWNRSPVEIAYLMRLFESAFDTELNEVYERGTRVRFIGQRERLPHSLQKRMQETEERTKSGTKGTLVIALSYGARAEILEGVNTLLRDKRAKIEEEDLKGAMWSAGLADPDIIIRTGGDKRLSNFLLWQSAYSELFFVDTLWPDFSKEEFNAILAEFRARERRIGK
jgi:undecaprenyl diphosphate synthase